MKNKKSLRIILCFLSLQLLGSMVLWSQENSFDKKHEFHINVASSIDGAPEISYHYLLNHESTFGIAARIATDMDNEYRFLISPSYRIFFGKKPAAGFFVGSNVAIFSRYEQIPGFFGTISNYDQTEIGFGIGIELGGKFVTKSGWIGELFIGVGRNLMNADQIGHYYPRAGVSIGKRF